MTLFCYQDPRWIINDKKLAQCKMITASKMLSDMSRFDQRCFYDADTYINVHNTSRVDRLIYLRKVMIDFSDKHFIIKDCDQPNRPTTFIPQEDLDKFHFFFFDLSINRSKVENKLKSIIQENGIRVNQNLIKQLHKIIKDK